MPVDIVNEKISLDNVITNYSQVLWHSKFLSIKCGLKTTPVLAIQPIPLLCERVVKIHDNDQA